MIFCLSPGVFTDLYKYFWSVAALLSYLILQQAGEITFIAVLIS